MTLSAVSAEVLTLAGVGRMAEALGLAREALQAAERGLPAEAARPLRPRRPPG